MKIRLPTLLYAVVALVAVVWLIRYLTSEERRIHRQLAALQELIEKEGPESNLAQVDRARRLGDLLTEAFEIRVDPLGRSLSDRRQLGQLFVQYRAGPQRIELSFFDEELEIEAQLGVAVMELVALVAAHGGDRLQRERYRLRFAWSKEEGTWRIRQIEVLEILDAPPGLF